MKRTTNPKLYRTLTMLLLFVFAGLLLTSCKTREKCAAYGEYRRFQVEQGY